MIDNYDSFTFNLVHYFRTLGQQVQVYRNDQITLTDIAALAPKYLVVSPGPCDPNNAGISLAAIEYFKGKLPILGVCLGHQAIAQHFGAKVVRAKQVMHGKTSLVEHNGKGLFQGLKQPLEVTRYHSLVVEPESLPDCFTVSAWLSTNLIASDSTNNKQQKEIMALQHNTLAIASVQFHPESVMTEQGHQLLNNFLDFA